ncbi:MAG: hypothetical protein MJE66_04145 [Proteobacteria bacterium]|nr:hypothetical protein [Pseudomonadota bacterium]
MRTRARRRFEVLFATAVGGLALACSGAPADESGVWLSVEYVQWQCLGDNGLAPEAVAAALAAAGIPAEIEEPGPPPPRCAACYPACTGRTPYRVRVASAAVETASAAIEALRRAPPDRGPRGPAR